MCTWRRETSVEAIRQYGLFKRLLHERLGIEPSGQIEQLIRPARRRWYVPRLGVTLAGSGSRSRRSRPGA